MFKHWKTSFVGVLLAALQAAGIALHDEKATAVNVIIAVATAVLGLVAKDRE